MWRRMVITPFPEHSSVFLERYSEVRDFPNAPPPKKWGQPWQKRLRVRGLLVPKDQR